MKKFLGSTYFAIVLFLLYLPIAVMMIFSFNSGSSNNVFNGWSLKWYDEFIHNSPFIKSIVTSLFVAVTSTLISLVIGMMAVIGLWRMPQKKARKWLGLANIPLINADVITAVALMVVFLLMGLKFGILTLIFAHVSFNVPYVIITVMPFVRKIDKNLISASKDLGSSETQTIFKVVLPILRPAIITAIFICFAMSFDDFIISYFTSGVQTNVSTFMYTAKRIQPYINAFGTILVTVIFLVIIIWNLIKFIQNKAQDEKMKIKNGEYKLKKISQIKKQITVLESQIQNETRIKKSRQIKLWYQYFLLKQKLKYLKNKNYNIKISKLEWKRELLTNEIRSEKRIFKTFENAKKKQVQLQDQVTKNPDSHRIPRFLNAIKKLDKKMVKLEREIEWINERRENEKEKVQHLNEMILDTRTEMANVENLTKKDMQWYNKKIAWLTLKRNIFAEGKNQYRLRTTIEKLATLRTNNLEAIQKTYATLNILEKKLYQTVSLTDKLDKKITDLRNVKNLDNSDLVALEQDKKNELIKMKSAYQWRIVVLDEKLKIIEIQRRKKYLKYFAMPDNEGFKTRNWFQRSWKGVSLTAVVALSFGGLTTAYVLNNSSDIVIGNWGSYIDMSLISDFEKEYGIKVNYQQYDSNESLYNKVRTMNYDVMVPSDYMVQRMASEDTLAKLDWTKIEGLKNPINQGQDDGQKTDTIDETLVNILGNDDNSILNYAVPYFWGDVRVALNLNHKNVQNFINENHLTFDPSNNQAINNFSWNLLWTAAKKGLKIDLSDDAKNLFMIGSKALGGGVEPKMEAIGTVKKKLETLVHQNNVSLLGDQLISQIGDGDFDIAVGYNGDILYGQEMYLHLDDDDNTNDNLNPAFAYAVPTEGTNVWSDNMVINKRNRNLDLSYKFINFIYENSVYLSEYVGYPVASSAAMKKLENETYKDFVGLFTPTKTANSSHFTFDEKRDNAIVNAYNEIIANKN